MSTPAPPSGPVPTPPVRDAPAFDFYPERWLVGVAAMSDAEQLSYLRLLCHQWLLGDTGLPADLPALKRLAGRGVTENVLAKLPQGQDGKRRNNRLESIRQEQRSRIARSRAKIEKMNSARLSARAGNPPLQEPLVEDHKSHLQPLLASPSPPTSHHPPRNKERAGAYASLHEVQAYAPTVMAPPECAEHFWNSCEGNGWVTAQGNPIADWKPVFRNYATRWKANEHPRTTRPRPHPHPPAASAARATPLRSDPANAPGRYA